MSAAAFFQSGWTRFPADPATARWAAAARPVAEALMARPDAAYRCDGTWFPGVSILANDEDGAVAGAPLAGRALDFLRGLGLVAPGLAWDKAQISACLPGYPRQGPEEDDAAHRFRLRRDAAHVDGVLRMGAGRRRRLGERHGFILGIAIGETPAPGASPFVIWEGSHEVMRAGLSAAVAGVPPARWGEVDVTEAYAEARRRVFETCPRVEIAAAPGEAYVVHRLALHGVAPWRAGPEAAPRIIAYFRPDPRPAPDADPSWWLRDA